jgi:two-component system, OmpR family, phosphate regulon sensor histidine kinase PhoR
MPARRLIWQLYASFLAIILAALGLATLYASRTVHDFYLGQEEHSLLLAAEVVRPEVAGALETKAPADIDILCKQLGQAVSSQMRLTIIALSGKVLGDSVEDPASMENHSNRPEVIDALNRGFGRSIRSSPTLGLTMMYVAVPVKRGDQATAVVRFAVPITAVEQTLRATYAHIAWVGGVVAIGAAVLGLLMSRRITSPIVQMKRTAQLFAAGQLNSRIPAGGAPELAELARALNEMAAQLQDRIMAITRQRNESQTLLSSLSEGVLAVDSQGRIVSLNKAAAHLLNIDPVSIQGRNVEEVIRNVDLQQVVRDILSSGRPGEGDVSLLDDGGRFFHVHGARLVDPESHRSGAVIVLSDQTTIHQLDNVRKDFVANVSHELKTPVTSIQGFVEALLDGGIEDPAQVQRYLGIIARHSERLSAIIDDLLALSRLEDTNERRAISFEKTALRPVLEAAIEMAAVRAERKRMTVSLSCDESVEAKVNAPLLEQAVLNLLDNAVKYSDEGTTVEVIVAEQETETAIHIRDYGCGIPAEHLPHIFQRFYVVDKSRSRKLGGTGLGLAIVKHIALVHQGRVTVDSTPGKGSTFTLSLPRI